MKDSINIDDILKTAEEMRGYAPPIQPNPLNLYGMPVHVVHDRIIPKLQISERFADKWLTDEAKNRHNAKLLKLLGSYTLPLVPKDSVYMFCNSVIMRPEQAAIFTDCLS